MKLNDVKKIYRCDITHKFYHCDGNLSLIRLIIVKVYDCDKIYHCDENLSLIMFVIVMNIYHLQMLSW